MASLPVGPAMFYSLHSLLRFGALIQYATSWQRVFKYLSQAKIHGRPRELRADPLRSLLSWDESGVRTKPLPSCVP